MLQDIILEQLLYKDCMTQLPLRIMLFNSVRLGRSSAIVCGVLNTNSPLYDESRGFCTRIQHSPHHLYGFQRAGWPSFS